MNEELIFFTLSHVGKNSWRNNIFQQNIRDIRNWQNTNILLISGDIELTNLWIHANGRKNLGLWNVFPRLETKNSVWHLFNSPSCLCWHYFLYNIHSTKGGEALEFGLSITKYAYMYLTTFFASNLGFTISSDRSSNDLYSVGSEIIYTFRKVPGSCTARTCTMHFEKCNSVLVQ